MLTVRMELVQISNQVCFKNVWLMEQRTALKQDRSTMMPAALKFLLSPVNSVALRNTCTIPPRLNSMMMKSLAKVPAIS